MGRSPRKAFRKRLGRRRRRRLMEPLHPHQGVTQGLLFREALTKWYFLATWTRLSVARSLTQCSRLLPDPATRSSSRARRATTSTSWTRARSTSSSTRKKWSPLEKEVLGELALIHETPRAATVVAK